MSSQSAKKDDKDKVKDESADSSVPGDQVIDLKFQNNRRQVQHRYVAKGGQVAICNIKGKILTKATIHDLSTGGIGVETPIIPVSVGDSVVVEFIGQATYIVPFRAQVQWITPIFGHPQRHRLMGLAFTDLTPQKIKSIEKYIEDLKRIAKFWT